MPTSNYTKYKLSGKDLCVIEKALIAFKTKELENERLSILARLQRTSDFFICMYSVKRKREKIILEEAKPAQQQHLFKLDPKDTMGEIISIPPVTPTIITTHITKTRKEKGE
jgi:hypothetical protein